ncbi:hypothetical protein DO97_11705 [Neosynechococcus sphagnicola sy1]|uniref:Outer membrane lipoprotein BamD-like domain-containing protein n=1 Tax=Neosynechococcus sphagnicola sy1 TaxID=1497020 RepID=A0A098TJY7_9CYAN|nr:tetratricopeptide repeat protein [Neosynechococcus sphagnicola]KGF72157.1 hypothetical protein DO97_11705 [Neosynechococcus sphagnicola sy1]
MSPPPEELLKIGSTALKQCNYHQAIQALEAFCQRASPDTPGYTQAQMWLVRAYKGNGNSAPAIALCPISVMVNSKSISPSI